MQSREQVIVSQLSRKFGATCTDTVVLIDSAIAEELRRIRPRLNVMVKTNWWLQRPELVGDISTWIVVPVWYKEPISGGKVLRY